MKISIRYFNKLTTQELYNILQLRSEVFVVEQNCIYQDIDEKDKKALHLLGIKEGKLIAYTRCFNAGDYFKEASIGRVVVKHTQRKHTYGTDIMLASIKVIHDYYHTKTIKISAQCYLSKFYNNLGFKTTGTEYLEDGIPHIAMLKK